MRRPPPFQEFLRYPTTAGTILLAIGLTLAWWAAKPVDPFFADGRVRTGEIWRLVTSALLHGDMLHLLFNAYWTWVFGTLIEERFGYLRTLLLIMLLAATSAAAEFAFLHGGVGLSGVGYGFFGMLWVLSTRDERFADAVDKQTIQLFVVWFFICIVATILGIMRVANIAHGVGCVAGIACGFAIAGAGARRAVMNGTIALATAGLIALAVWGRPYVNFSRDGGFEEQLGYDALEAGKPNESIRWMQQAIRIEPRTGRLWYNLGVAHQRADQPDQARTAYARATEIEPDNAVYRAAYQRSTATDKPSTPGLTGFWSTLGSFFRSNPTPGDPPTTQP